MKVIIEQVIENSIRKATIESDEVVATEVLRECIQAMLGMGFHDDSVRDAVLEIAEEYEEEK